jgi:hypothetical protein
MKEEEKELNPLEEVERQGTVALGTYVSGMTSAADNIDKAYANVDAQLAQGQQMLQKSNQDQLDYTIDEIERQKAQTRKDYEKEQKAAFTDYQKQVDPYGVNAENMAAAGLDNSGFAESSKVAMYNQYQQRVAVARESMQRSIAEYDASIAQAKASNSVYMAQLAYETLMKKMQYTTEKMLKKNDLLVQMTEGKAQIQQNNTSKWMAMYEAMNSGDEGDSDNGGLPIDTDVSEDELTQRDAMEFNGGRNYNNVKAYLENKGFAPEIVAGLKTRKQWRDDKGGYKTYKQYLDAYLDKQEEVWDAYMAYLNGEEA